MDAVLGIIGRELEIAKKAPQQVRSATRTSITGESDIESQVKASGIPYEPDKFNYRVIDGKLQRKSK